MKNESTKVPDGFFKDAKNRLVPESMVRPIDRERDALVRSVVAKTEAMTESIAEWRKSVLGDINAFITLSAEQFGAKLGGQKGNVTLNTYDGSFKIVIAVSDVSNCDERINVAKALIDECIEDWSASSGPEIKIIVSDTFKVDGEGKVNPRKVLDLRKFVFDDPRWNRAMEAIADAIQVVSSKAYLRIYRRDPDTNAMIPYNLDGGKI